MESRGILAKIIYNFGDQSKIYLQNPKLPRHIMGFNNHHGSHTTHKKPGPSINMIFKYAKLLKNSNFHLLGL